jgi:hypothetical protein
MPHSYALRQLTDRQIEQAHVFIGAVAPEVDLSDWRRFCKSMAASGSGPREGYEAAIASDRRGYIRGLCVFASRTAQDGRRRLEVPLFAPLAAVDSTGVARSLLNWLEQQARRRCCQLIVFRSLAPKDWSTFIAGEIGVGEEAVTMTLPERDPAV